MLSVVDQHDCGGFVKDQVSSTFKAGLVLEQAVSTALTRLGIQHRRTEHSGTEDVLDKLDFIVSSGGGRPDLEIQLTLKPKAFDKILDFAYRALTTTTRGIRLYIEVVGSHHRCADLTQVGQRVAQAIKLVVRRFRDFGSEGLLGLRIHTRSEKIEKFDLITFCGRRLLELMNVWQKEQEEQEKERLTAQQAATTEYLSSRRCLPFWHSIINPTVHFAMRYIEPRYSRPNVNTRSHFMPRRLC